MTDWPFTGLGRKFFDGTLPRLCSALERIATELEKQNEPQFDLSPLLKPDELIATLVATEPAWEVEGIPIFSTAHIMQEDTYGLTRLRDTGKHMVAEYPEGYFVWLGGDAWDDNAALLSGYVCGETLMFFGAVAAQGYHYIRLDSDGPTFEEFKTYEW